MENSTISCGKERGERNVELEYERWYVNKARKVTQGKNKRRIGNVLERHWLKNRAVVRNKSKKSR